MSGKRNGEHLAKEGKGVEEDGVRQDGMQLPVGLQQDHGVAA